MKTSLRITLAALAFAGLSQFSHAVPGGGSPQKIEGAGLYFGLVDGSTFDTSGCLNIVVSGKGATTVGLKIGSEKSALTGQIDATTKQFVVKTGADNPHDVAFGLVIASGAITRADGTLTVDGSTVAFSALVLGRKPTGPNVPAVGKFTAVLDGTIGAAALETTAGVAKVRVLPGGKLKVNPRLADGSVLPFVAQIAADGSARFWRSIGKTGALTGTLQFTNDPAATADVTGTVNWFKPAHDGARFYPEAFDAALTLEGSRYQNRAPILDFSASAGVGVLTVDLSEFAAPIVVEGTLDEHNKFTIAGDGSVKLGFNRGVGLARGSAKDAVGAEGALGGVVLQKQNVARGIVFGAATTGEFQLTAKP